MNPLRHWNWNEPQTNSPNQNDLIILVVESQDSGCWITGFSQVADYNLRITKGGIICLLHPRKNNKFIDTKKRPIFKRTSESPFPNAHHFFCTKSRNHVIISPKKRSAVFTAVFGRMKLFHSKRLSMKSEVFWKLPGVGAAWQRINKICTYSLHNLAVGWRNLNK